VAEGLGIGGDYNANAAGHTKPKALSREGISAGDVVVMESMGTAGRRGSASSRVLLASHCF